MKVSQGVTTVVVGNCGVSLSPLIPVGAPPPPLDLLGDADDYRFPTVAEYAQALERTPPATNAGVLVGHSTLRVGAVADLGRAANRCDIVRSDLR